MSPSRRRLFQTFGATGLAAAIPRAALPQAQKAARAEYLFFQPQEASFIEAAVARLIPKDELGPGAVEAGVPVYIDRQLAGAFGAGERLYRSGPWREGTPSQGYQLPFTPAELFRNALRAVNAALAKKGGFQKLAPQEQDGYLDSLQKGKQDLNGVPASVFFESLLAMTVEGYFADPVYGGNRDMAAWKMIGFPGAYANYYDLVGVNVAFDAPPLSLGQDARGHVHPMQVHRPAKK